MAAFLSEGKVTLKEWIALIVFVGTVTGVIIGATRYADSKPSESDVKELIQEKTAPIIDAVKELKSDMKEGFSKIERKLDRR